MGLLMLGPFSFAQNNPDSQPVTEEHNAKDLNKVINDYNKDAEKVLKDTETLNKNSETSTELPEKEFNNSGNTDIASQFKKLKSHELPKDLKKVKYSDAIKLTLEPLRALSDRELQARLKEATQSSGSAELFKRYPVLVVLCVNLIKDQEALPRFVSIADDQDKLIKFAGFIIGTMALGIFIKMFFKKEGRSILGAISLWFVRFTIITSLRLVILYSFYGSEITPAFKIISKTLF